jgi:hypothetical protein
MIPIVGQSDAAGMAPRNFAAVATDKCACVAFPIEKQQHAGLAIDRLADCPD